MSALWLPSDLRDLQNIWKMLQCQMSREQQTISFPTEEGGKMIKLRCLRCASAFASFTLVGRIKSTEYAVRGVCANPQCPESK